MSKYNLHIGFWIFILFYIFDYHWLDEISWQEALGYAALEVLGYAIIFYLNLNALRRFFDQYKFFVLLFAILTIAIYVLVITQLGLEVYFYDEIGFRSLFSIILNVSLFAGLAWLFFFTERNQINQQKNLVLQATNSQLQLEVLKSKINPHFLFNALNNLNALILQQHKDVPSFISKLSTVLRYGLDVGHQKHVLLADEITYLKDYLSLIQLQQPASDNIDFYVEGIIEKVYILPFILVTLLENAIKYGNIQQNEAGFLHIYLSVSNIIHLEMENSVSTINQQSHGMGLENIQEQLKLYYGDNYSLNTFSTEHTFKVELSIPVEK